MKKRIILILTFLLTTMFLTGCTVGTTNERIKAVNKVANEVAENGAGYKLPEGYYIKYPDTKDTGVIEIISTKEGENTIYAKYEIVDNTAQMINIILDDNTDNVFLIYTIIILLIGVFLGNLFKK